MKIGKNLKTIRELRNYTQEYVAELIGISQVSYSRIEKGTCKLDIERLQAIALVLEVDIMLILNFDVNIIFKNFNHSGKENSFCNTVADFS